MSVKINLSAKTEEYNETFDPKGISRDPSKEIKKLKSNLDTRRFDDTNLIEVLEKSREERIELLNKSKVTLDSKPAKPKGLLYFSDRQVLSSGNIMTYTGKAKAAKTKGLTYTLGNCLTNKEGFKSDIDKKVVWFDTEMSEYDVYQVLNNLNHMGVNCDSQIDIFSLSNKGTKERVRFIQEYTDLNEDNIDLIIVDGSRDLVYDINSPQEAQEIIDFLKSIIHQADCGLINILHQNKGQNNELRGHLGTEMTNKSETVLEVVFDKETEVRTMSACQTRNGSFEDKCFKIDDYGRPYGIETPKPKQSKTLWSTEKQMEIRKVLVNHFKGNDFALNEAYPIVNKSILEMGDETIDDSSSMRRCLLKKYLLIGIQKKDPNNHKSKYTIV